MVTVLDVSLLTCVQSFSEKVVQAVAEQGV